MPPSLPVTSFSWSKVDARRCTLAFGKRRRWRPTLRATKAPAMDAAAAAAVGKEELTWPATRAVKICQKICQKGNTMQHRNICECGPTHRFGQHSVASVFCFLSYSMLVHVISMSFLMFLIPCLAELAEPKGWSQLASSGWGSGPRKQLPCCEAETYKETCERCVRLR